nr:phosphatase PAP2 family protein [Flavobacterium sp. PL002]
MQVENDTVNVAISKKNNFSYKQLIVPVALMSYGLIGIESDYIKGVNSEISEEVVENIDRKISIDDFSQYAPAAAVYGLNAMGIKGKHNLKDRSIILGSSFLLMSATVLILKSSTKIERPDGSSKNSFPSGHTATAFAGAEFLWQEYKDVSIWYGISGYIVASGTGIFRIYNDRHWLTDVAMGAGIGILSTKIAYWTFPLLNKKNKNPEINAATINNNTTMVVPFYNGKQGGLSMVINLK